MPQQHDRYWLAKKVTLIGGFVNALLGILKIVTGYLFHSHALIADGIHSFADLFTDIMVLVGSKYGSQDADDMHPYGHQRIETATTLFLSLILILAGAGIAWDAIDEIIKHTHQIPQNLALPVAIISIVTNELLFHYTHWIGKKIKSALIIANAWHRRSDASSSLVVLIGLIGSYYGYQGLDAIAAVIVSILIIKMGWDYGWNSVKELVDTGIEPSLLQQIETIILQVDGVIKIHQLRSRSMGGDIYIDLHIQVSPWITVSEGHYIAQTVHNKMMGEIHAVKDVTVHVDPEDDENSKPSIDLPNRSTLEQALLQRWQLQAPEIQYWMLNYLDGILTIDLFCTQPISELLFKQFSKELTQQHNASHIRVFIIATHNYT
jgi:cation diffusion facilitator family transporter